MEVRKPVSKTHILEKVSEFDIFKAYVTHFQEINQVFKSDLRDDKRPSCIIGRSGSKLIYRDFTENRPIDCFTYMMRKYNVGFYDTLEMINIDFGLKLISSRNINYVRKPVEISNFDINTVEKIPVEIKVKIRPWNKYDKVFWSDRYGVTIKELKFFKVFALEGFWLRETFVKAGNLSYGYYFGNFPDGRQIWKIYQPNEKIYKWLTNAPETIFQGMNQLPWLGEDLIITKSLKDVIVLRKLGVPAIAPQGETVNITYDFLVAIKKRFTRIWLLYDNDKAGVEAADKIRKQHDLPCIFIPIGQKDASDLVEKKGLEALGELLKQWNIKSQSLNG